MKYQAVIFDLGGTLMATTPRSEYLEFTRRIAAAVSAPHDDFRQRWFTTYDAASRGAFADAKEYVADVCRQMGIHPAETELEEATAIYIGDSRRRVGMPRMGAIETLSFLRSHGYKTGLITSCGPEVPGIWPNMPYAPFIQIAIFSCTARTNKDDTAIFLTAAERLATDPATCLYVADGFRGELTSAARCGMYAVQLRDPTDADPDAPRDRWDGASVSSLAEILKLL